jgi:arylsulfatase A-like enzyme
MKRHARFAVLVAALMATCVQAKAGHSAQPTSRPPNVIILLTDDQGSGDVGCHGNPYLRTPTIDRFAQEGVELSQFYVSPLCAPTRASLLTGRYHNRTKVDSVWNGLSLLDHREVTLAQLLRTAGYRTGIFGKWHLGDNYPMRPTDKGFDRAVWFRGGALFDEPDRAEHMASLYTDPWLWSQNQQKKFKGYCMDIFTDEALTFIEANAAQPFFLYLAANLPHTPLEVGREYSQPYRAMGLTESCANAYGMIANVDANFARVLEKIKALGLEKDTLIIFMSDNGASPHAMAPGGYNAGLRDWKGTVYEGGIRVPFFMQWPTMIPGGRKLPPAAAHIDVAPTVLDACGVRIPANIKMDGISLLPLLCGKAAGLPERSLFFPNAHVPAKDGIFAVRSGRYKVIRPATGQDVPLELYDIINDFGETSDVAKSHPEVVRRLKGEFEKWFDEVYAGGVQQAYRYPLIFLGDEAENPSILWWHDKRGVPNPVWFSEKDIGGYWEVEVKRAGLYKIALQTFDPMAKPGGARLTIGSTSLAVVMKKGERECAFEPVQLAAGCGQLKVWVEVMDGGELCPEHVIITRMGD